MESATNTPDLGYIELVKCELVNGHFRVRGEKERIGLREAVDKFTPNQKIGSVVLKARSGAYLGIHGTGKQRQAFLIYNTNRKGDISWLLAKNPALKTSISEVYMVKEIEVTAQRVGR
jgi:hypothetical protein